jgi:uncharacterized membrane protein
MAVPPSLPTALRVAALLAAGLAYSVASTHAMLAHPGAPLTVLLVLGPMAAAAAAVIWRAGLRLVGLGTGVLGAAALWWTAASGVLSPQPLYVAQHAGIHVALALWFGATLLPGRTPLVTRLAARLHPMDADMNRYTRKCTISWVVYFTLVTIASIALYASAPFTVWTLVANVQTPTGIALMLAGEYALRYRLHPEFERVHFSTSWRAWRADRQATSDG